MQTRPSLHCRTLLTLAILAVAAGACRSTGADTELSLESLPALHAEEELRIGDRDDPRLGFSRVYLAEVDSDGTLYVVEGSVPEIRVFSPEGELLRRIGRRGDGPGEFQSLIALGVQRDTLWTVDSRHRRITLFDVHGPALSTAPIEEATVQLDNSRAFTFPRIARDDGTLMGQLLMIQYSGGDPGRVRGPDDLIPVPLMRFNLMGEVIDTIGWASRPPPTLWRPASEELSMQETITIGGRPFGVPRPPPNLPLYLNLADGYLLGDRPMPTDERGTVTLTRFAANGDTIYRKQLHYRAPRYTSDILDRIASAAGLGEGMEMSVEGGSAPPIENPEAVASRLRASMAFPEFQMPITRVLGGADGSVWLAFQPALETTTTWILFAPDGTPRGSIPLPSRVSILWHTGDTFYAAVPDELEIPWVVRYHLAPRGRPTPGFAYRMAGQGAITICIQAGEPPCAGPPVPRMKGGPDRGIATGIEAGSHTRLMATDSMPSNSVVATGPQARSHPRTSPRWSINSVAAARPARFAPIVDAEGPYPTR